MKQPIWVSRRVIISVHGQLVAEFGGAAGVRDEGLLDSALNRPINLFAYGKPEISDLAAAYAFGLVKNRPFIDGNKRIGFATAVVFLELNGRHFRATEADATIQTLALAAGALGEAEYVTWIKANSTPSANTRRSF